MGWINIAVKAFRSLSQKQSKQLAQRSAQMKQRATAAQKQARTAQQAKKQAPQKNPISKEKEKIAALDTQTKEEVKEVGKDLKAKGASKMKEAKMPQKAPDGGKKRSGYFPSGINPSRGGNGAPAVPSRGKGMEL